MPADLQASTDGPAISGFRQRLDVVCEWGIAGLVLLILLWGPMVFGGLPSWSYLVMQGLTIVALALWAVRIWAQPQFRLLWPPVCWAVFIFLLYAIARCRLVEIKYPGQTDLMQTVVYAALFFLVINNFQRRRSATVVALTLIGLGMVLSWLAVFQFGTHYPRIWGVTRRVDFVPRGGATFLNPNHFADFLAMLIPLALSYTLLSRFKPMVKVFFAYCGLAMLAGAAVSLSRGGIMAAGVAVVAFWVVLLVQRGHGLVALGLLVGLAGLGISFAPDFMSSVPRFEQSFIGNKLRDFRPFYWTAAAMLFWYHPICGIGPGQFDLAFFQYRPRLVQSRPMYAHNDYLNTLSEWGLVGMVIIALAVALVFYAGWKSWVAGPQVDPITGKTIKSDKTAFLVGAGVGLVAICFHCLLDFNMHIPANATIAVVLMALISAQWRYVTERCWKDPGMLGKVLLTAVILGGVGWLSLQEVGRGREAYWQGRAADEHASYAHRFAALEKAYAAQPDNYVNAYHLGEYYRMVSEQDDHNYARECLEAMRWYARCMAANPEDAFVPMRYGMCLDGMGRSVEGSKYFNMAEMMDPNNAKLAYHMAVHCLDRGDCLAARSWIIYCLSMDHDDLEISLLGLVNQTLQKMGYPIK